MILDVVPVADNQCGDHENGDESQAREHDLDNSQGFAGKFAH